jgi:hypothetical protein
MIFIRLGGSPSSTEPPGAMGVIGTGVSVAVAVGVGDGVGLGARVGGGVGNGVGVPATGSAMVFPTAIGSSRQRPREESSGRLSNRATNTSVYREIPGLMNPSYKDSCYVSGWVRLA